MDETLFRKEAIDARRERLGAPVKPLGVSTWLMVAFFAVFVAVLAATLAFNRYSRKETVMGQLTTTAGTFRVVSLRPGIVSQVHVVDGQRVVRGQKLITVSLDAAVTTGVSLGDALGRASAETGAAKLEELRAETDAQARREDELRARIGGAQSLLRSLRTAVEMQGRKVALAAKTVADVAPLADSRYVSVLEYRRYQDASLSAEQSLASLQKELATAQSNLLELHQSLRVAQAQSQSLRAKLDAESSSQKERSLSLSGESTAVIVAKDSGTITALTAVPGKPVAQNVALAIIVPDGAQVLAELWVPSKAMGFVASGQEVRLMYDAYPYQRFGIGRGYVRSVSNAPLPAEDLHGPSDSQEPLYRVLVRVPDPSVTAYGKRWRVSPGMRLTADMVLERRSFVDWLLDPIRAARQRMS